MSAVLKKKSSNFLLKNFSDEVDKLYRKGIATEHSYRHLLISLIQSLDESITVINEPKRIECGAPDFILLRNSVPVGYIEAKDINVSLEDLYDTDQFRRYTQGLKNVIFTNHHEFMWFVDGKEKLRFELGTYKKSKLTFDEEKFRSAEAYLSHFLESEAEEITNAHDLARMLATLAQSINGLILTSLQIEKGDGWLTKWFVGFQQTLVPGLKETEFSDMFAQTLAYGLFAARVHVEDKSKFSRYSASSILPKTNPFLRKLFAQFAGESMPETISWAVDEIVEVLKRTDIDSIKNFFGKSNDKEDAVIHFYEDFLTEYNPSLKQKRGVYYTPDSLVGFITRSVDEILVKEFKKVDGIADDQTLILDPALGTASFLFSAIEKIYERKGKDIDWNIYVRDNLLERMFGFEILMAPYSIAHLKIGLQLQRRGYQFNKEQRLGVYLTNTLEETAKRSNEFIFDFIAQEANSAFDIKRDKPIVVVMGNPPYSGQSENNGEWISNLMKGYDTITKQKTHNYFECDGKSLGEKNPKWLNDDYVKFIRFAQWRIEQTGYGTIAFVTNHGFIDNPTFRGMRESLMKTFDDIYILDLHGNSKKKEVSPDGSKDENVFDIQQGVSISFFVKKDYKRSASHLANVYRADLWGARESKYEFLKKASWKSVNWKKANPTSPNYFYLCQNEGQKNSYSKFWPVDKIFRNQSVGVVTGRDGLNIHFNERECFQVMKKLSSLKASEARAEFDLGKDSTDWKVQNAIADLIESKLKKDLIVPILYRPFDIRRTYYTGKSNGLYVRPRSEITSNIIGHDNLCLITARTNKSPNPDHFFVSKYMSEVKCGESTTGSYLFPLYLYDDQADLLGNKDNLDDNFKKSLGIKDSKACFYYIYAILYSSVYRETYKDFFKLEFPRVPVIQDLEMKKNLIKFGKRLVDLHTLSSSYNKNCFKGEDSEVVKVLFDVLENRLFINKKAYFDKVSKDVWEYTIGGHRVLEKWLRARSGRVLVYDELIELSKIIHSLNETIAVIADIDSIMNESVLAASGLVDYIDPVSVVDIGEINTNVKNKGFKNRKEVDEEAMKRLVLSSAVVENTPQQVGLGSVKLQKVLYLLDMHLDLDLKTEYIREAAGPLDYNLMYADEIGVQSLGKKYSAFQVRKRKSKDEADTYEPMESLKKYSVLIKEIFGNKSKDIYSMIKLLSGMKRYQAEIAATLYACWNDLIISKKKFTDDDIISEYLTNWHPSKQKFSKQKLKDALGWMKLMGLVPKGKGKATKVKIEKKKTTKLDEFPF